MFEKFRKLNKAVAYTRSPHIPGDSFSMSKKAFAVADGVTRIKKTSNGYEDFKNNLVKVPADIFCEESAGYLKTEHNIDKRKVLDAFKFANEKIAQENKKRGFCGKNLNYLDRYFLSTTAALTVIKEDKLLTARICDCDVFVLRDGKIFFRTPQYWSTRKKYDGRFGKIPEKYPLMRGWEFRYLRNKPELGKMSHVVLTGEKQALEFIDYYEIELKIGDKIILATDGFRPYMALKEFRDIFDNWNGLEKRLKKFNKIKEKESKEFSKERTLIAINFQ